MNSDSISSFPDSLRCWWDISGGWLELSVIAVPVVAILQGGLKVPAWDLQPGHIL